MGSILTPHIPRNGKTHQNGSASGGESSDSSRNSTQPATPIPTVVPPNARSFQPWPPRPFVQRYPRSQIHALEPSFADAACPAMRRLATIKSLKCFSNVSTSAETRREG
ncbi:hypothetical protein HYDPIDRAFT_30969 [Hydnomerulius pinastri MD-312]|uniref:Uncharacterized protein n=1 Tax=Hydnomerulius pinastri MD-312 TaxID=994086 RepID=A0A0C9W5E5_9AGAM|nr:hypothetical protein HYDPIDRAFT_30969 [Hydnomerulius pinastri MD-312]